MLIAGRLMRLSTSARVLTKEIDDVLYHRVADNALDALSESFEVLEEHFSDFDFDVLNAVRLFLLKLLNG
jgi:hypothetical protein